MIVPNLLISFAILLLKFNTNLDINTATDYAYLLGFIILLIITLTTNFRIIFIKHTDFFLIALSIILYVVQQYLFYENVPHRDILSVDALHHITGIRALFAQKTLIFDLTEVSPTFTVFSYLPIYHYVLGPLIIYNPAEYSILTYSIIERLTPLFFTLLLLFVYKNLKYKPVPILIGIIISLFLFERVSAYTSVLLLPQNIVAFGTYLLLLSYEVYYPKTPLSSSIANWILFLWCHFYVGLMGIIITFFKMVSNKLLKSTLLTDLILLLGILILVLSLTNNLNFYNWLDFFFKDLDLRTSEFATYTPTNILNILFRMLGWNVVILSLIFFGSLLTNDNRLIQNSLITILIISLIASNLPYAAKLLSILHFVIVDTFVYISHQNKQNNWVLNTSILTVLIAGIIPFYNLTTTEYKSTISNLRTNSYLAGEQEYTLIQELNKHPHESILLSDPLTMSTLEPISQLDTPGGIFTSEEVRLMTWQFFQDTIPLKDLRYELEHINSNYKNILILETARTQLWIEQPRDFIQSYNTIWKMPNKPVDKCILENRKDTKLIEKTDYYCLYSTSL
jgi:hypothetical protein